MREAYSYTLTESQRPRNKVGEMILFSFETEVFIALDTSRTDFDATR